jgi:flagellar basal body-associated protein FliL
LGNFFIFFFQIAKNWKEKFMKKQMKNQNGITLIALVITIILLLILAGVTISTVAGDNGILSKAKESSEKNKRATLEEEAQMVLADWQTDYFVNKTSLVGRIFSTESGAKVVCGSIFRYK